MAAFYRTGSEVQLQTYTERSLRRAWWAQSFSYSMTTMLHQSVGTSAFDQRRQDAELDHLMHSHAAQTDFAQNYTGLPFAHPAY
jgi:p-hydroxybenzoate 3-monooxygenase